MPPQLGSTVALPSSGRILIAEGHPTTREGMAMIARAAAPGHPLDFAGTVAEAETLIKRHKRFRLILLDLLLPDSGGLSGYLRLQFALVDAPIVLFTARPDVELATIARSMGAAGFLSKAQSLDDHARALREVLAGGRVFPPEVRESAAGGTMRDRIATLSIAERRVLFALANGALNKQIAGQLAVTEATIKAHMTAILRKLNVNNRIQAILSLRPLLDSVRGE